MTTTSPIPGSGRLRKGALRALIYDYLVAHADDLPAGQGLGPTAIAKGLGKSTGAVDNALIRLEEEGKVTLVQLTPPATARPASELASHGPLLDYYTPVVVVTWDDAARDRSTGCRYCTREVGPVPGLFGPSTRRDPASVDFGLDLDPPG